MYTLFKMCIPNFSLIYSENLVRSEIWAKIDPGVDGVGLRFPLHLHELDPRPWKEQGRTEIGHGSGPSGSCGFLTDLNNGWRTRLQKITNQNIKRKLIF